MRPGIVVWDAGCLNKIPSTELFEPHPPPKHRSLRSVQNDLMFLLHSIERHDIEGQTRHNSKVGISGGGRGDGDALGTNVPSGGGNNDEDDWNRGVTRQQQLHMQHNGGVVETSGAPGRGSGGDGEDGSGPLSGTFSGGDDGAVYGGFFALQLVCSFTPNPSSQMLSAISSLFANRRPGSTICLGDTGAVIHGVSSADCVYNRRQPRPWERYLMLGDGKCMTVGFCGDLDLERVTRTSCSQCRSRYFAG